MGEVPAISVDEATPLVPKKRVRSPPSFSEFIQSAREKFDSLLNKNDGNSPEWMDSGSIQLDGSHPDVRVEHVVMKRHIKLVHAIAMIVGGVAGSGIFISPTGVTQHVGSVGASLITWVLCGIMNLLLALCYAEMGTSMPVAGGDVTFIYKTLGAFPSFLCLWAAVVLVGPVTGALMGRTVGTYFSQLIGMECYTPIVVIIAIWTNYSAAIMNALTVKWTARGLAVLSAGKMVALGIIIITGFVKLGQGPVVTFYSPFEGTRSGASDLILGFIPGFVAYLGWENLNTMAEEMENPGRNLPLSVTISMVIVTGVYVLTNLAYFTVLTPTEFVATDAVASLFAQRALPFISWAIPVFVIMSAAGSALGTYLSFPRYAFAGGRSRQIPQVFSFISMEHYTPLPAIIFISLFTVFFCSATFFDLQALIQLCGILIQLKIVIALIALAKFKIKNKNASGTIKVPLGLVIFCIIFLLFVILMASWSSPQVNGIGVMIFFSGAPVYVIAKLMAKLKCTSDIFDRVTMILQQWLLLVPGGK